jgi:DNA-binding response OmpR family regulator
MSRVLIVEDEKHLADGLCFNLDLEGYEVDAVETGEQALHMVLETPHQFDLMVLDVMLPGIDGFSVVVEMRRREIFLPVLILTARGRPEDVLTGFGAGADDYLPKPFELAILLARIRGLLRRSLWNRKLMQSPEPDTYSFAGKKLDFTTLQLEAKDTHVQLTLMEMNLLRYLIRHEGKAVSRKQMLEEVWGVRDDTDTRPIDNFIVRLRRYIEEDPAHPRHLLTVRGVGYRFVARPEE